MPGDGPDTALQALVATIDYPMFVVTTAAADGERAGCLVGFATQCSLEPARFLVCISRRNHTLRVARRAEVVVVHFLGSGDVGLARLFGENTGDEVDKFARCTWDPGPGGAPIVRDCRGWVAGRVIERFDCGDHVAFLLDPVASDARRANDVPLGFQDVRDLDPGHEA